MTIRELKTTDSGRYRCGVVSSSQSKLHEEMVEIRVIEGEFFFLSTFPQTLAADLTDFSKLVRVENV